MHCTLFLFPLINRFHLPSDLGAKFRRKKNIQTIIIRSESSVDSKAPITAGARGRLLLKVSQRPLFGWRFDRDMSDRATEVQLQITYAPSAAAGFDTQSKLFLCANYSRQVNIRTQNGSVVEVQSLAV